MSSQVVRLRNGDTVQVRTGSVQGIGPEGPRGGVGPAGPAGPKGDSGERGPTGYVDESVTLATTSTLLQPVAPNTATFVEFPQVLRDDLLLRNTAGTFKLPIGTYFVSAWVRIRETEYGNEGNRIVRLKLGNEIWWEEAQPVAIGQVQSLTISGHVVSSTDGALLGLEVEHTDLQSQFIEIARIAISRIGAGATGPAGPAGKQGPVGATGPRGPQGEPGTFFNPNLPIG